MHVLSWFEIPSIDINRAQTFYEDIFLVKMINMDNPNLKMRVFPVENRQTQVSGALVCHSTFYRPAGEQGVLIYLNAGEDLAPVLGRVEKAGGHILIGKTQISDDFGYMAIIVDSEGNRIGLHSDH